MSFIPALALIGAVACLPKLLWEELENIEANQLLFRGYRAKSVRFMQVENGNFILMHTIIIMYVLVYVALWAHGRYALS